MAADPPSSSRLTVSRWSASGEAPTMNGCASVKPRYFVERFIVSRTQDPCTDDATASFLLHEIHAAPGRRAVNAALDPAKHKAETAWRQTPVTAAQFRAEALRDL